MANLSLVNLAYITFNLLPNYNPISLAIIKVFVLSCDPNVGH